MSSTEQIGSTVSGWLFSYKRSSRKIHRLNFFRFPLRMNLASQFFLHMRTPIAQHSPILPGQAGSTCCPQCVCQSENHSVFPSLFCSADRMGFLRVIKQVIIFAVNSFFNSSLNCFIIGWDRWLRDKEESLSPNSPNTLVNFCVSWGIFAFMSSSAVSGQCSFTNSLISSIDIFSTSTFFGRQANEAPRRHVTKRNITWLFYACASRPSTRDEGDSNRATVLVFGTDRRFVSMYLLKLLSRYQISRSFLIFQIFYKSLEFEF